MRNRNLTREISYKYTMYVFLDCFFEVIEQFRILSEKYQSVFYSPTSLHPASAIFRYSVHHRAGSSPGPAR